MQEPFGVPLLRPQLNELTTEQLKALGIDWSVRPETIEAIEQLEQHIWRYPFLTRSR